MRDFLNIHGRPEDRTADTSIAELILCLRKFLVAHLPLCGSPTPTTPDSKYTAVTLTDLVAQPLDIPNSVCFACLKASPSYVDSGKAPDTSIKCLTTVLLQGFLNNIRIAEDIPDALEQCS